MRPVPILLGRALLVGQLGLMGAVVASAAEAADEVIIEATALRPPVLATTVGQRIAFVNRSGRPTHVEFFRDDGEHRVFQVPGQIWVVFNRTGRHHYVVHFSARREGDLRGAVDVTENPDGRPAVPMCTQRSAMGECLEP